MDAATSTLLQEMLHFKSISKDETDVLVLVVPSVWIQHLVGEIGKITHVVHCGSGTHLNASFDSKQESQDTLIFLEGISDQIELAEALFYRAIRRINGNGWSQRHQWEHPRHSRH